jgi:hypothetical protein
LQINKKHFSRTGSKAMAMILNKLITEEQISVLLSDLEADIQKDG